MEAGDRIAALLAPAGRAVVFASCKKRMPARFLALLLLAAGPAATAAAQPPVHRPREQPGVIRAEVEVVNVDVTVTDARGNFVRGLNRENFRILDEGVEQEVTHFAPIEAPAVVLILVETSPAVYLLHRQHLEAAYTLADGLAADDQVALASYDQSLRMLLPLSSDKRAFRAALGGLRYNLGMGELHLFDAVHESLRSLASIPGKKAIMLLSTGLDSSGRETWDALEEVLRASEVTIYPIALGGGLREFQGKTDEGLSFEWANMVLKTMAETTGGRAFFPRTEKELSGIYRRIATTMRHRYSLAFTPPARDGRYHHIEVQVGSYRAHARPGYLAPAP